MRLIAHDGIEIVKDVFRLASANASATIECNDGECRHRRSGDGDMETSMTRAISNHQIDRAHWSIDQLRVDPRISTKMRNGLRRAAMFNTINREHDTVARSDAEESIDSRKTGERHIRRDVSGGQAPTPAIGKWSVGTDLVLDAKPVAPRNTNSVERALENHGQ